MAWHEGQSTFWQWESKSMEILPTTFEVLRSMRDLGDEAAENTPLLFAGQFYIL
jgi:hypothetical protein